MTVSVASRIFRPAGLSDVGSAVVGLIDGGQQWLNWAMRDQMARYHFADESALVAGIQTGLHGSPLMLMPGIGLLVSPVKLMTLSLADLQALTRAEASGEPIPRDVQRILAVHALARQADLIEATATLKTFGVADAPLFQAMGLDDQLALLDGQRTITPSVLNEEAARFAVEQARTPVEFVDYFRVYVDCSGELDLANASPKTRGEAAQTALNTLLPLSFASLDCPKVEGLVAPWEVGAAVSEWLLTGHQIGFGRASLAVQQVIANGGYTGQTGADAVLLVRDYLTRAQLLLNAVEIGQGQGRLGQDGATCIFPIVKDGEEALIELSPTGVITLRRYGPSAAAKAKAAKAAAAVAPPPPSGQKAPAP